MALPGEVASTVLVVEADRKHEVKHRPNFNQMMCLQYHYDNNKFCSELLILDAETTCLIS